MSQQAQRACADLVEVLEAKFGNVERIGHK
jgi:hypothetical protein